MQVTWQTIVVIENHDCAERKYPPIDSIFLGKIVAIIINEAREDCCYRDRNKAANEKTPCVFCVVTKAGSSHAFDASVQPGLQ